MSWIYGLQICPGPQKMEHHILLCHFCDVALLVEVRLLFVKVAHLLVQQPIEQFDHQFLVVALFHEPILSSAGVVQSIIDRDVALRLPGVVLED